MGNIGLTYGDYEMSRGVLLVSELADKWPLEKSFWRLNAS
jgi:hypothetical protein